MMLTKGSGLTAQTLESAGYWYNVSNQSLPEKKKKKKSSSNNISVGFFACLFDYSEQDSC